MSLKKKKFIYYAVIVAMVLLLLLAVFVVDDIPGCESISTVLMGISFVGILLDVLWIRLCFRCPDCGRRLPMNSMFRLKKCPGCGKEMDLRFFD